MNTIMKMLRLFAACSMAVSCNLAWADSPIRILIGAPPGGGTDLLFRLLAQHAAPELNAKIVAMNLPGAGGSMAVDQVRQAQPDGTTLGALPNSTLTSTPHLMSVSYTVDDYIPVIQVSAASHTWCVKSDFPAQTASELVEAIKAKPDHYTIGTDPGIGQVIKARISDALGIQLRTIPYKGASEVVVALLSDSVDIYQGSQPPILPHVAAGKVRCLLVTGRERSGKLPQAASLSDMNIAQESTTLTRVLVVNKATPSELVEKIRSAFDKAARTPEVRQLLADNGDNFVIESGDKLMQDLAAEYDTMGAIARQVGIAR